MSGNETELTKVERRLLDEILVHRAALSDHPARSRTRRRWPERLAVAVIAAVSIAIAAVLVAHELSGSPSSALAAIPPLTYHAPARPTTGRAVLLHLAAVAAAQPPSAASGRYAYVKTAGWYLDTAVGGGRVTSRVDATTTESWLAADGSGRQIAHRSSVQPTDDWTVPAGKPLLALSSDPATIAKQLDQGHPVRLGPAERFVSLHDIALEQPLPPPAESAALRVLAGSPGLIDSGTVTDRAGRPGVAVSLDSAYSGLLTRHTLIFDPRTGRLLGDEETLIGDPGKLNVRTPAVISYTVYLSAGYVSSTTEHPR